MNELEEPEDFGDGADKLWSLYEDVAKRHDEVRIRALKTDMDGIPVYVCEYFFSGPSHESALVYIILPGWFDIRGYRCICCPKITGFASKSCTAITLLPATIYPYTRSNIPTNCIDWHPDPLQYYYYIALSYPFVL